jgi:hypothetical protein
MRRTALALAAALTCVALAGCLPVAPTPTNPEPAPSDIETVAPVEQGTSSPTDKNAVLEALRVPIEEDLGQPVTFQTTRLELADGWAFVQGKMVKPDGTPVDYSKTSHQEAIAAGAFDDGFAALLHFDEGTWSVVAYEIGSTDVPWVEWPQAYGAPQSIFPPM